MNTRKNLWHIVVIALLFSGMVVASYYGPLHPNAAAQQMTSAAPQTPNEFQVFDVHNEVELHDKLNALAKDGWAPVAVTFGHDSLIAVLGRRK